MLIVLFFHYCLQFGAKIRTYFQTCKEKGGKICRFFLVSEEKCLSLPVEKNKANLNDYGQTFCPGPSLPLR